MTDQHILDVVNTQGLENVEYKESFRINQNKKRGSFNYNNSFLITKATIDLDHLVFDDKSNEETYTIALKIANSNQFITETYEFPIEETEISVNLPLVNTVPEIDGQVELAFSENVTGSNGLVTVNYTRVPR
jgi:hypothetical protein